MDDNKTGISLEALLAGNQAEFSCMVDAEDILQNTFSKAFQHLKDFKGRSTLST